MGSHQGSATHEPARERSRERSEPAYEVPWVREGIVSGLLGAAAVALIFFFVDLAAGRPLWTPHALGAALFRGELAAPDADISPALIGGYTVIHGWVFVSIALVVAAILSESTLSRERRWARVVSVAVALFGGFSAVFLVFGMLRGAEAARPFPLSWIFAVNAVAAVVMALWLGIRLEQAAGQAARGENA